MSFSAFKSGSKRGFYFRPIPWPKDSVLELSNLARIRFSLKGRNEWCIQPVCCSNRLWILAILQNPLPLRPSCVFEFLGFYPGCFLAKTSKAIAWKSGRPRWDTRWASWVCWYSSCEVGLFSSFFNRSTNRNERTSHPIIRLGFVACILFRLRRGVVFFFKKKGKIALSFFLF